MDIVQNLNVNRALNNRAALTIALEDKIIEYTKLTLREPLLTSSIEFALF